MDHVLFFDISNWTIASTFLETKQQSNDTNPYWCMGFWQHHLKSSLIFDKRVHLKQPVFRPKKSTFSSLSKCYQILWLRLQEIGHNIKEIHVVSPEFF